MTSTTARDAPAATRAHLRARQASITGPTVRTVVTGAVTGAERDRLAAGLGALLRDARRARGWSGHQLAARIGAAASTVHRLENGTRRPRPVMLRHLADALAAGATAEERQEVVASLRESGLSIRAIAAATGAGVGTVHRELATVPDGTVGPVQGVNGKTYAPHPAQQDADLIAAAEVVSGIPDSEPPVTNARQAVELARVPEPERAEVWAAALYAALVAAAGPSLAEDTPGGVRRRQRRALRVQQTATAAEWRRRRLVYEAWLRDQQAGLGSRRFAKAQAEHAAAFDRALDALGAAERAGSAAGQLAALERVRLLMDADPLQGVLDRRDWWQANLHRLLPDQGAPRATHTR
jgi:transcriptional regulator with XRE-family HTH domain